MDKLKVLDLFSGIGGFSLGLERAGMETEAFCEIEDYPVSILNKHWPDIPVHRDIRKLDGKQYRDSVDVICGGFPCQPFSVAGKQRGKEDDRHLWPEMLRLIKEVRPTWVIGENVAGFIRMALDDVLLDLETEGYATQPFVVPACAVGAVHRRDRVWIIGYSEHNGQSAESRLRGDEASSPERVTEEQDETRQSKGADGPTNESSLRRGEGSKQQYNDSGIMGEGRSKRGDDADNALKFSDGISINGEFSESQKPKPRDSDSKKPLPNADNERLQGPQASRHAKSEREKTNEQSAGLHDFARPHFKPIGLPTESPVCHRDDGVSDRVARLKALGNAVVPQIPELIGRAIIEAHKKTGKG